MAYEQRDNSGTLFRNDKKANDSQPNATGKAMIGGVLYYVSAWTKDGNKGKFQSLSFTPVTQDSAQAATKTQPSGKPQPSPRNAEPFDDEVPF